MEKWTAEWEQALRPWRWALATIDLVELAAVVATGAALTLAVVSGHSYRTWASAAAGVVVALEFVRWVVGHEALRRAPQVDFEPLYASAPLGLRQRQILLLQLVLMIVCAPLLAVIAVTMFDLGIGLSVLIAAVLTTSFPRLFRVWRCNSWLAISPIPLPPRTRRVLAP